MTDEPADGQTKEERPGGKSPQVATVAAFDVYRTGDRILGPVTRVTPLPASGEPASWRQRQSA